MKKKILVGFLLAVLVIALAALPSILKQNTLNDDIPAVDDNMVRVRIAGVNGVVFDEITDASASVYAIDLLNQAVGQENVVYKDSFINSVMGVEGVVFYTVKNGVYEAPAVSVAEYPIAGLDEIVFYNYNLAPMAVKADKNDDKIELTVTKAEFDTNFVIVGWQPLAGAMAELDGQTASTDAQGKAVLTATSNTNKIKVYAKDASGNHVTVPVNLTIGNEK